MRGLANIPNLLTVARILLAPLIFSAIVSGRHVTALVLFAGASLTDGLDGIIARHFAQSTQMGAYLDPIADKILVSGVYLSLAVVQIVPWWLVLIIFSRDIFLLVSSVIALLFTGFREFRPSVWGKASTFIQIACAVVWMAQNAFPLPLLHSLALSLLWPTAALTIWSGLHYSWRYMRLARTH